MNEGVAGSEEANIIVAISIKTCSPVDVIAPKLFNQLRSMHLTHCNADAQYK
jgi:hypothetical protein